MNQNKELKVFNNQFVVKKKLSSGSFGVVFQGEDKQTGDEIALKIEKEDNEEARSLDREVLYNVYNKAQSHILQKLQGIRGIPKLYWIGCEGAYNVMVIQLLGRDLAHYVKQLKKFTLKTVLMLAQEMVSILEQCHNKTVIHRDMKPENVLVGKDPSDIYLVDFGISKIYRERGQHIPFRDHKPFIGTTRYASVAAHNGYELGRVDDLESLGYMLVFLFKGVLPWQNLQNVNDKDKTKIVGRMKQAIEPEELCQDMPSEFVLYFRYLKTLRFMDQPDYQKIQSIIRQCAVSNHIQFDKRYEWVESDRKQSEKQSKGSKGGFASNTKIKQGGGSEKPAKSKRQSLVVEELQSNQAQGSQFDFLKLPDPHSKGKAIIDRAKDRHKSVSSLAPSQYSHVNTFQSSIANQYQQSHMNFDVDLRDPKVKEELIKTQNFGFHTFDDPPEQKEQITDTINLQTDEDIGPSQQYLVLKLNEVRAQFKTSLLKIEKH